MKTPDATVITVPPDLFRSYASQPSQPAAKVRPPAAEVSFLARTAWQREGCPAKRRPQVRREVELQLRATRHLWAQEFGSGGLVATEDEPI